MDNLSKRNDSRRIDLDDINHDLINEPSLDNKLAEFNQEDTLQEIHDLDNDLGAVPTLFEDQPTVNANADEPTNKKSRMDQISRRRSSLSLNIC